MGFARTKSLSLSGLASLLLLQLDTQPWPFCPLSTGHAETTKMWRAVTARKAQKQDLTQAEHCMHNTHTYTLAEGTEQTDTYTCATPRL